MPNVLKHRYLRASYLSCNFFEAISEAPCGAHNTRGANVEARFSATQRAAQPAISRNSSESRYASGPDAFAWCDLV